MIKLDDNSKFMLKFANELNKRNVEVLPPIHVKGGAIIGGVEYGPLQQISCNDDEDFIIEEFTDRIINASGSNLQFLELLCPTKAVSKADLLIKGNILLRYIECPDISTDGQLRRWDALFKKAA